MAFTVPPAAFQNTLCLEQSGLNTPSVTCSCFSKSSTLLWPIVPSSKVVSLSAGAHPSTPEQPPDSCSLNAQSWIYTPGTNDTLLCASSNPFFDISCYNSSAYRICTKRILFCLWHLWRLLLPFHTRRREHQPPWQWAILILCTNVSSQEITCWAQCEQTNDSSRGDTFPTSNSCTIWWRNFRIV